MSPGPSWARLQHTLRLNVHPKHPPRAPPSSDLGSDLVSTDCACPHPASIRPYLRPTCDLDPPIQDLDGNRPILRVRGIEIDQYSHSIVGPLYYEGTVCDMIMI